MNQKEKNNGMIDSYITSLKTTKKKDLFLKRQKMIIHSI